MAFMLNGSLGSTNGPLPCIGPYHIPHDPFAEPLATNSLGGKLTEVTICMKVI